MGNKYFLRFFIVFVLVFQLFNQAKAQHYAVGGTAGSTLTGSVFWLNWDPTVAGSTLISAPASSDANHVTEGTYVWQYSPTVRITAIMSNQVFTNAITMVPYTPGNFEGDGLDLLYSGNNLPKPGSRGIAGTGLATTGNSTATFDIDVKVAILINGVYTDVNYPGMVIGDAESIDSQGEYISGDTPNPVAWQLLNKRSQGGASDDHYLMDLSNGGRSFRLRADLAPGNFGVQAVMFARGARNLNNVSMRGSGITAMAIGFVLPFDLGDNPATYGATGHYIDNFAITDVFSGDGTYAVVNYPTTPLIPQANVYIGANNVDADGNQIFGAAATNDDLTGANDEATLTPSALPDLRVNQPGDYSVTLPVTNGKNVPATLYGWIDFNRDGVFGANEVVTATIPANTTNQNITLNYPNALFSSIIRSGLLYARFRISTTNLVDVAGTTVDERSTAFAADGEAEDYNLKSIIGISISGTVVNDPNGNLDASISGIGISTVAGSQLFAYLVSGTTIVNKAAVAANGTYTFAGADNGTYIVAISTNNAAIGGTLASVAPNLPLSWVPSGEAFGLNNGAGTGIETGTPNLQIAVSTPGTSLDVTGLDFGLDQAPIAVTDNVTAVAGQPLAINVLANDSDPDGTVDITSVRIIDPADNVAKTSVTIPNQGTYTVNTTNGVVTFTPLITFAGTSTPVTYTIRDNYGAPSATNLVAQISATVRPAGVNDTDITLINTPVTTNVRANDGAVNATATVIATQPTNGTTVTAGNQVTYTPNTGFTGVDTYTYTLTNGALVSDPITVTVTVSAVPIGVPDNGTTPIATAITTNVLANDGSFAIGSTVAAGTGPANGAIVVNANNTITYTPNATFTGVDTYTYTITKNAATSAPITVTINVQPVGANDVATTPVNTAVATNVKANDGNSATGTTVTAVTTPANGTTTVAGDVVTYTPNAGFIGIDSYTYRLSTAGGIQSDPITVNVTVRPVGVADASSTPINTAVATTVLANDGVSGTGATVTPINGANGTTAIAAGVITFTPTSNFVGVTTYTYTLTRNGIVSDPITVTITVNPVAVDDAVTTPLNTAIATTVTANDGPSGVSATVNAVAGTNGTISAAGNVITFTPTTGFIGTGTYTYTLTNNGATSAPATVTVTIRPVGVADVATTPLNTAVTTTVVTNDGISGTGATVTAGNGTNGTTAVVGGAVTYTPNTGFIGVDTYTYTLTNNGATSTPITVTVNVTPVGVADAATTPINTAVTTNVITNDGASGTGATVAATPGTNGTTTVAGGVVTYTPNNNFIGIDTYTYTLTNNGTTSAPITVTVRVRPVGVADPAVVTATNTPVTTNVITNDGISGTGTTVTATPGTNGTTTVNAAGNIIYTPNPGFTGTDTYTYTLTTPDGVVSDPITVTVTVSALPAGVADITNTPINTATTTAVLANDGADGVGATVAIGTAPLSGTAVVNADNTITFTPATDLIGVRTYTYTLTRGGLTSGPITVTVNVRPVGVNDASTTNINAAIATVVKTNDGASATGTTVTIGTVPAHGTTAIDAAGVITFTPTTGYVGLDTYTYILNTADGVASLPVTVNLTVRPVGVADVAATTPGTPVTTAVKTNDGASAIGTTVTTTNPTNGTVTVNAAGEVTYTPNPGFAGVDTYTYTLTTPDGVTSLPIPITVNVSLVGVADVATTTINTPIAITVKANDGAVAASATVTATQAANGTTAVNAAGVVTYTPNTGFMGVDTYTYTLTQGGGVSNPILVTVNVRPVGTDDAVLTNVNSPIATTVKANDGASATNTTVTATQPLHGTTTVSATGVVTYTPTNNYIGLDSYTYVLTTADGVASLPVTVNVRVRPVGVADAISVVTNTATQIPVKANDGNSGVGTTVTATTPLHGTVTVNAAGVITYTPTTGYTGPDSFTYTLTTPDGVSSTPVTVSVSVGAALPIGSSDLVATPVNTAITANVVGNDADGVGSTVNAGSVAPSHGVIVVNADNTITYTPAANYVGLDNFTYTLTKAGQTSTQIVVTVGVIPTGATDATATTVGSPVLVNVKNNDGPSGASTIVDIASNPANGTATVNAAGVVTYTPTAGYIGADSFTYTLVTTDGVTSDPIRVNVTVTAALPVGIADEVTTPINTAIVIDELANDPGTTPATTVTLGTAPLHGTVTLNANRTITYTPVGTYTGKDNFTYTITRNGSTSLPIAVTVNIKPVASPDAVFADITAPTIITVKANDGNSATNSTVTVTAPTNGTATVNANGQVIYTPNPGYSGPDSFTYRLTTPDGVVSDPVTVTVTVTAAAGVADTDTTPFNTPITTNVRANDGASQATATVAATNGSHGTTVVNANGTVTYTPINYVGLDTYTYTLTNGGITSAPITVTISVKPVGTFDGASTPINTPVTTAVKNNDGASGVGTTIIPTNGANGTTSVNPDGTITYTPATNYTGTDTYTYTLRTSDGVVSDPISVTVSVRLVGVADNVSTLVNVPVTTNVKANDGVSGNGANVTPTDGLHGTTTVNAAGLVTYTPNAGYSGLDTYTYTLSIPGAVSDQITVTVSIKGNGLPDVASTDVGTPVAINVKGNDGATNANATVVPLNGQFGTAIADASGVVTYTPSIGFIGNDTFTYTLVTPDGVASDPITVSVTVRPQGVADTYNTPVNTAINNAILVNDGVSANGATITLVTPPANGTAVLNADNTFTYTPATGSVGVDNYTYRLTNNGIQSNAISVTINVTPIGVADLSQTPVNTPVTINVKANDGAAAATATVVIATQPAIGTATVNAAGQVIYTPANNYVGTQTFTYTLNINGAVSAPINITVIVYASSMTLTKVATNTVTKVGDVINYNIVVTNTGTAVLNNVVVTDAGADAGSITPSNIAILPAGANATVTARHTVTQADVDNGGYVNQASVRATDQSGNPIVGPVSDDPNTPAPNDGTNTVITANTAIKLTKTGVATADQITYTFLFENIGNTTLVAVNLTDIKLGINNQAMIIPGGSLAPGATFTFTSVYTLTDADKTAGTVTNSATATGTDGKGNTVPSTGPTGTTTTPLVAMPKAMDDVAVRNGISPVIIPILDNDVQGTVALDPATITIGTPPSNGSVTINADGTITYTPNAGYTGPDAFTYRVKDVNGNFTNEATVNISGSGVALTPPTLFTPNGDGVNDTFEIRGLGAFAVNDITITNRWGNAVYRSTGNYQNNWTGEGLNEGTYYYVLRLKVNAADGNYLTVKGWVTLLRTFKK
ncbi:CshA/CshB family fibrillar adhesin-related protein [Mucilaginibacter myungsuensis]|uniref:Tandem-95 repeat protein n=1 Tax=Mucilaginibacter myungsuensis TaxID=649104 RepID=A0A929PYC1_9SPHI|nr:CshA/CshB family fibrillar adhesin-related protein [Mucilaginibacter myungsuensis]MBE9664024.1 tandem-95 repeat protein [Mucilaginibacter myungsuensis]MDN3601203.1 Ig-like domain-containing protein [Mucilaginibacter myungsuensis]